MTNTQYLALLRGINVGGGNLIKTTDLKACFEAIKPPHQHQNLREKLGMDPDFVLNSLRHIMLTRLGESGAGAFTIKKIAGQHSRSVSERYVRPRQNTSSALSSGSRPTGSPQIFTGAEAQIESISVNAVQ
jgi:hypothetical protein